MSGHRKSIDTVPSPSTGSNRGSERRSAAQGSSGESSEDSRIDSTDRWRIGGPGRLPPFPLSSFPPPRGPAAKFGKLAVDIAINKLIRRELSWKSVRLDGRVSEGHTLADADTTLLIQVTFDARHSEIFSLLDDLIQVLYNLGFPGRVEIIDPRAMHGPMSFPPSLTTEQQRGWDKTLEKVIEFLTQEHVDWRQVCAANRGYWKEVSVATVLVKANASEQQAVRIPQLADIVSSDGFHLELMGTRKMWGLFSDLTAAPHDKEIRLSLGWPFTRGYNPMGVSIGRSFEDSVPSTLGGYLRVSHGGSEHVLGLTCYHGVRMDQRECVDKEICSKGSTGVKWPCQSPCNKDINILLEPFHHRANAAIRTDEAPYIIERNNRDRQTAIDKIQEARVFDPYIGDVLAVSGWRNRPLTEGSADSVLMDWALVDIPASQHPFVVNQISDFPARLLDEFPEALPCWKSDKPTVDKIAPVPSASSAVFKVGRTTGLTAGFFGDLVPAGFRIREVPGHLHHRAYVVQRSEFRHAFCGPGDSGAWCLNGEGEVVGLLIGGDMADGSGLMVPFSLTVADAERMLGLEAGSIKVA